VKLGRFNQILHPPKSLLFYTTKSAGMGMDLHTRSIVQNHGGRLWASASMGPVQFSVHPSKHRQKEHVLEPALDGGKNPTRTVDKRPENRTCFGLRKV
jgi:hypothetical protein